MYIKIPQLTHINSFYYSYFLFRTLGTTTTITNIFLTGSTISLIFYFLWEEISQTNKTEKRRTLKHYIKNSILVYYRIQEKQPFGTYENEYFTILEDLSLVMKSG